MRRENKEVIIDSITNLLNTSANLCVTDLEALNAEKTSQLRRLCFNSQVKLVVVKNALLKKAMERTGKDYGDLYTVLKGTTALMLSENGNAPAKLIKTFRKNNDRPILKGAYIEECVYLGDNMLDTLASIKSKNELIADVIALLQSPVKNVLGALQSGGHILSGVVKTLSERPE